MPDNSNPSPLRFHIMQFDTLASTNLYVVENKELHQLPEGTVILAKQQTAGIGQSGNRWSSETSKNLTFSIILHPVFLPVDRQFYLHKVLSVALWETLSQLLPNNNHISIKWPNDIYIGRCKVCGMLVNNQISGNTYQLAVAGIGLNVNQTVFDPSLPNPTSLKAVVGKDFQLFDVLKKILSGFEAWYNVLKKNSLQSIDEAYLAHLLNFGQPKTYTYRNRQREATIVGVDKFGRLQLHTADGSTLLCDIKEIQYIF